MIIFARFQNSWQRFTSTISSDTLTRFPVRPAECAEMLLKLIGQMETETTRYHLILLLLPLQQDALIPPRLFSSRAELRGDEAVTAQHQRAAGIIRPAFHQGSSFHDSSSVILSCNRGKAQSHQGDED